MTKVLVTEQNLQDIADSIRNKNGSSYKYKPDEMSAAVDDLRTDGVLRPTTWAEFASTSITNLQKSYGVGDRVGIACPWKAPSDNKTYDLMWEIAAFGTTKKENDNTNYPCVTLVARLATPASYQFDAPETPTAATEETAQAGIYYYGFDGSTYNTLNLSIGDSIPYSSYTVIYKTDVTDNVQKFNDIRQYGYNVYKYSTLRQWLNTDSAANNWWQASHVGDVAPNYASQAGFMSGFETAFKNVLQRTEVITAGNNYTDDGSAYKTYDYFFLPSRYELYGTTSPVEGDRISYFGVNNANVRGLTVRGPASGNSSIYWWERSAGQGTDNRAYYVGSDGGPNSSYNVNSTYYVVAACKIILIS